VNYRLFRSVNDLTGNAAVDAVMKFAAKYAIFVVFFLLASLCVRRLLRRELRPVLLTWRAGSWAAMSATGQRTASAQPATTRCFLRR
jgi:hypothetical protein